MSASTKRKPSADSLYAAFARATEENRGVLRHHFSALMVEHLIDCLHAFGDLEEMLVLEFIKDRFLHAHLNAAAKIRQSNHDPGDSVTASLIAAKTGIPRQTVRRKLLSLERRGLVTQTEDAAWRLSTKKGKAAASGDLAPLDKRGLDRLASFLYTIQPYVGDLGAFPIKQGKTTVS